MRIRNKAKQIFTFLNDGLDDDIPDLPSDDAAEETYNDASYARSSACLSDNLAELL